MSKRRGFRSNRKTEFADLLKDHKCAPEIKELLAAEEAALSKQVKRQQTDDKDEKTDDKNKKTDDKDEKKILANIASLEHQIKGSTLGAYLYSLPKGSKKRGRHTSREMYEQEFETLWEKQKYYHPKLLNDSLKKEISKNLFFQNPLKIQKFLVGKCSLEPTKKRCNKALLEFQQYRIWQDINNIQYYDPELPGYKNLNLAEKQKVFQKLQEVKSLSWSSFRNLLKLGNTSINLEGERKTKKALSGNSTACDIRSKFPVFWKKLKTYDEQSAFIKDCVSIVKTTALYQRLKKQYEFTPKDAFEFIKLGLARQGYASVSLKAINKLLVPLSQGKNYHDACQEVGYQREDQRTRKILTRLPYIPQCNEKNPKNKAKKAKNQDIRNPVVVKALVELRKVINALLDKYEKFDYIRVELARDLKNGKQRREEIDKKNRKIAKEKKDAKEDLVANSQIKQPTSADILKYRLWKECEKMCPYTGKTISFENLFSGQFEVEHIIPYSRSLDNSYLNKTLCCTKENREVKKNKTPDESYTKDKLNQIETRLRTMKTMPTYKEKKFFLKEQEVKELLARFTTRHLNDTRYISKLAKEYLKCLGTKKEYLKCLGTKKEYLKCLGTKVEVANGTLTANLRGILGFKKDRNDHRHHAIDAIMVGLTEIKLVQQISKDSVEYQNNSIIGIKKGLRIPEDIKNTFSKNQLDEKLAKIVVSHYKCPDQYLKGALHKETAYGKMPKPIKIKDKEYSYTHRVALENLTEAQLAKITDKYVRELITEQIAKITGNKKFETKRKELCSQGLIHQNKNAIRKVRVLEQLTNVMPVRNSQGVPYKYYQLGSNHHLIIFENLQTKKIESQVVATFTAATRKAKKQSIIQKERAGYKYLLHLKINDMFYLKGKTDKGELIDDYYRVQKLSQGKDKIAKITFRQHTRAETGDQGEGTKGILRLTETSLLKYSPQKLKLNSLGEAINSEV